MAAHVYWRVRFTLVNGGATDIWLAEVSFRSAADADLSVGGTAFASGNYPGGYSPAGAFDKSNTGLGWASPSGGVPSWIAYQHASAVDVASVLITFPTDLVASDELPVDGYMFLEWSDDGTAWQAAGPYTWRADGAIALGGTIRLVSGSPGARASPSPVRVVLPGLTLGALVARAARAPLRADALHGGQFRVPGTVKISQSPTNLPVRRQVRLLDKRSGALVREVWSDAATGAYSFEYVALKKFFVVTHDHELFYKAAVADSVTPEPMP